MDVGISSAVFYPLEPEKAVDKICRLGFKKTEMFLNCESEYSDSFVDCIKDKNAAAGVQVVSVHPYTSLIEGMLFFTPYPRRVDDAIAQYRKYFRAAQRLGAKYFTFHGDRSFNGTVKAEIPMDAHCEVISRLADAAADHGILLCQENVSWCSSRDVGYIKALRTALGGKIGFTLDVKQARRAGVAVEEYIRAMGGDIRNVHISDYSGDEPCLLPGEGELDYVNFLNDLSDVGYGGDLIIEVYSSNFTDTAQVLRAKRLLENRVLQFNG